MSVVGVDWPIDALIFAFDWHGSGNCCASARTATHDRSANPSRIFLVMFTAPKALLRAAYVDFFDHPD